tara:strand:+ start:427 stop:1233 length:807 start_codon:yes stop_codon:yes gene_type:complete
MDLKRLSHDTLIHIITDLEKQNDKLKEENDKYIEINEEYNDKLKEENDRLIDDIRKLKEEIDIKKIYINDISRKLSLQPIIEKKDAQTITDNSNVKITENKDKLEISDDCNVWYMNGNLEDINKWDIFVDNNFVNTWNSCGQNETVKKKIKKGDIIAWHIVGKGYNSILKVIDSPKVITERELNLLFSESDKKRKIDDMQKNNYEIIIISVEFLATTKTNFVTKHNIENYHKTKIWTHGLRGSNCQSPGNPDWINQVTQMYNYLKKNR